MTNNRCIYYVEGSCEEKLVKALKLEPAKLNPGKVKVFNVIQNIIPNSVLMTIHPNTYVVLAFDTDKTDTEILKKNVENIRKYCKSVKIVYLPQVLNFEDEIKRCCNLKDAKYLTKSKSHKDFKSDFCKMKNQDCRNALERNNLDINRLWSENVPSQYSFVERNAQAIKIDIN